MEVAMLLSPSVILDALPHRPPFRFLTSVSLLNAGNCGEALWTVDGTEPFFDGHFPGRPIVPGLLITEALAQLSGLVGLFSADPGAGKLAHVDVRFKEAVVPPAEILLRSRLVLESGQLFQFEVEARLPQQVVVRGRLVLAGSSKERSV
jgi:3-hydroxyacyl-[acyl-carrier-protein] dehydratase